jgi:rhomboid protease GluP
MSQARLCPSCRRLNSAEEDKCFHCGSPLKGLKAKGAHLKSRGGPFAEGFSATQFLVGLSVVNFAVLVLIGGSFPLGLFGPSASQQAILGAGGLAGPLGFAQPWRLVSANFVHLNLLHLGMNLYALLSFGRAFEERYRGARLIFTYVFTGVCGFALSSLWYGRFGPTTAGASASLFGLIGVEIAVLALRRDPAAKDTFFQYLFVAVALAFIMPVNNFAHLGGFAGGLLAGGALHRLKEPQIQGTLAGWTAVLVAVVAILCIFLSLLTLFVWRNHASP